MKKWIYDVLMIVLMAAMLTLFNYFDLLTRYAGFAMIPLLIFYFAGQFGQRRFGR